MDPSDSELVWSARGGDAQALAVLLMRHHAAMIAVAAGVLGGGPEVEDVVQDASLVALTDLGRLRNPAVVRGWLTGITRNLARARLRRAIPISADLSAVAASDDPWVRLEQASLRDWVWAAIGGLSQPLQDVVVLRYFSGVRSYAAIAAALGVPAGTVRSRLHQARTLLAGRLRELESRSAVDHLRVEQEQARLFTAIVAEYNAGTHLRLLAGALAADARLTAMTGDVPLVGREAITRGLGQDMAAGVRLRLLRVVAGTGLTVVEAAFVNPPEAPEHCPPFTTQVFRQRGEEITRVHPAYAFA